MLYRARLREIQKDSVANMTEGHRVLSLYHRSWSYARAAILGIRIKY